MWWKKGRPLGYVMNQTSNSNLNGSAAYSVGQKFSLIYGTVLIQIAILDYAVYLFFYTIPTLCKYTQKLFHQ